MDEIRDHLSLKLKLASMRKNADFYANFDISSFQNFCFNPYISIWPDFLCLPNLDIRAT